MSVTRPLVTALDSLRVTRHTPLAQLRAFRYFNFFVLFFFTLAIENLYKERFFHNLP